MCPEKGLMQTYKGLSLAQFKPSLEHVEEGENILISIIDLYCK